MLVESWNEQSDEGTVLNEIEGTAPREGESRE